MCTKDSHLIGLVPDWLPVIALYLNGPHNLFFCFIEKSDPTGIALLNQLKIRRTISTLNTVSME